MHAVIYWLNEMYVCCMYTLHFSLQLFYIEVPFVHRLRKCLMGTHNAAADAAYLFARACLLDNGTRRTPDGVWVGRATSETRSLLRWFRGVEIVLHCCQKFYLTETDRQDEEEDLFYWTSKVFVSLKFGAWKMSNWKYMNMQCQLVRPCCGRAGEVVPLFP